MLETSYQLTLDITLAFLHEPNLMEECPKVDICERSQRPCQRRVGEGEGVGVVGIGETVNGSKGKPNKNLGRIALDLKNWQRRQCR